MNFKRLPYFIDWLVALPDELEELYYKEIQTIEKEERECS